MISISLSWVYNAIGHIWNVPEILTCYVSSCFYFREMQRVRRQHILHRVQRKQVRFVTWFHRYFSNFFVHSPTFNWALGTNLIDQGCDKDGNFTIISHGWTTSINQWSSLLIAKFIQYRTGCVIYMNYGVYGDNIDYPAVFLNDFQNISDALSRRLQQLLDLGVSRKTIFLYGHSLGARIVLDAATTIEGVGAIDGKSSHICDKNFWIIKKIVIPVADPAGPLFELYDSCHDPKDAADNVQCIHTSGVFGTTSYKCHQDWLMGLWDV